MLTPEYYLYWCESHDFILCAMTLSTSEDSIKPRTAPRPSPPGFIESHFQVMHYCWNNGCSYTLAYLLLCSLKALELSSKNLPIWQGGCYCLSKMGYANYYPTL